MSLLVILDAGPLGLVTNPRESRESRACKQWLQGILTAGARVVVSAVSDYEVRRELIRAGRHKGIQRLDQLVRQLGTIEVDQSIWRRAAELWAQARAQGVPTAHAKALDADVILAAQAMNAAETEGWDVAIATTNVGHLARFVRAETWSAISIP